MKTLKPTQAWILLCSIIVLTSEASEHSSHHNGLPYHRGSSPRRRKIQPAGLPIPIQMPEQVLSTQDLSCISADKNIFEILHEAKENCQGNDMVCSFFLFANHKYYNIGTVAIDKVLFDRLLMKYDNWLLTAENFNLKDTGKYLQERYLKLYSNETEHKSHNRNAKNKLGKHDHVVHESLIDSEESLSDNHHYPFYVDDLDEDDDVDNEIENGETVNPVYTTLESHHNKDNGLIDVAEKERKSGNYIKLNPKYDHERKYFEVFLPKDKHKGEPRVINVEINGEDNGTFHEEEFEKDSEHNIPLEIELTADKTVPESELNVTDNAYCFDHSSGHEHENDDQHSNHDQIFNTIHKNTDFRKNPVNNYEKQTYVTDKPTVFDVNNENVDSHIDCNNILSTDFKTDNIGSVTDNIKNSLPLVHNHLDYSTNDKQIVDQSEFSSNECNINNSYNRKNDNKNLMSSDSSTIVESEVLQHGSNVEHSLSSQNNDIIHLNENSQEMKPQDEIADSTFKDIHEVNQDKLEDNCTDNAHPQIEDNKQRVEPCDFASKMYNLNGYQRNIAGDTTENGKSIVNLSQNIVVPNKYVNQAKYCVVSELNTEKIPNGDIRTDILKEVPFTPQNDYNTADFNANIHTMAKNDVLETKLSELSNTDVSHLEEANIVRHSTNNSMETSDLNTDNSLVENVDKINICADIKASQNDHRFSEAIQPPNIYSEVNFDDTHDFSIHDDEIRHSSNIHHNEPVFDVVKPFRENDLESSSYIFALPKSYLHSHTEIPTYADDTQGSVSQNQPIESAASDIFPLAPLLGKGFSKAIDNSQLETVSSSSLPALTNTLSELPESEYSPDFAPTPPEPDTRTILPVPVIESATLLNQSSETSPFNAESTLHPSQSRIEEIRLPTTLPISEDHISEVESSIPIIASSIKESYVDSTPASSLTKTVPIDSNFKSFSESLPDNNIHLSPISVSPETTTSAGESHQEIDIVPSPPDFARIPAGVPFNSNVGLNIPLQILQSPYPLPSNKPNPLDLGIVKVLPFDINPYVPRVKSPLLLNTNQYPYVKLPEIPPSCVNPLRINSFLPASEFPLDSVPISLLNEKLLVPSMPVVSNVQNLFVESDVLQSSPLMHAEPSASVKIPQYKMLPEKKNIHSSVPTVNSDVSQSIETPYDDVLVPSSSKATVLGEDSFSGSGPQLPLSSAYAPLDQTILIPITSSLPDLTVSDGIPVSIISNERPLSNELSSVSPVNELPSAVSALPLKLTPQVNPQASKLKHDSKLIDLHESEFVDLSITSSPVTVSNLVLNGQSPSKKSDESLPSDLTSFQPLEPSLTPSQLDLDNIPFTIDSSKQAVTPAIRDKAVPSLAEDSLQSTPVNQATLPNDADFNMPPCKNELTLDHPIPINLKTDIGSPETIQFYEDFDELPETNITQESYTKSLPSEENSVELNGAEPKLQLVPIELENSHITETLANGKPNALNDSLNKETVVPEFVSPNDAVPSLATQTESLLEVPTTSQLEASLISPALNSDTLPVLTMKPNKSSITSSPMESTSPQLELTSESILNPIPEDLHLGSNIQSGVQKSSLTDTTSVPKPIFTEVTATTPEFISENTYPLPVDSSLPPTLSSPSSTPLPSVTRRLPVSNIPQSQEIPHLSSVSSELIPNAEIPMEQSNVLLLDDVVPKPAIFHECKTPISPIFNAVPSGYINPVLDNSAILEPIPESSLIPLDPHHSSSPSSNFKKHTAAFTPQSYIPASDFNSLKNVKVPHSPLPSPHLLSPSHNLEHSYTPDISTVPISQFDKLPSSLISHTDPLISFPLSDFTIADVKPIPNSPTVKPLIPKQYPSISSPSFNIPLSPTSFTSPILSSKLTKPSLEQLLSADSQDTLTPLTHTIPHLVNSHVSSIPAPYKKNPFMKPLPTNLQLTQSELLQLNNELRSPVTKTSSINVTPSLTSADLPPISLSTPLNTLVSLTDDKSRSELSSLKTPLTKLLSQDQINEFPVTESDVHVVPHLELSSIIISGNKTKSQLYSLSKPLNVDYEILRDSLSSVESSSILSQHDSTPFSPQILLQKTTLPSSLVSQIKPLLIEPSSNGEILSNVDYVESNAHLPSISNTLSPSDYTEPSLDTISGMPHIHTSTYIEPISKLVSIAPSSTYKLPSNLLSLDNIHQLPISTVSSFPSTTTSTILSSKYNPTSFDIKDRNTFRLSEESLKTLPQTTHATTSKTVAQSDLVSRIHEFPDLGESLFENSASTLVSSIPMLGHETVQPYVVTKPSQMKTVTPVARIPALEILPIPPQISPTICECLPINSILPYEGVKPVFLNPQLSHHPHTPTSKICKPSPLCYSDLPLNTVALQNMLSQPQNSFTALPYDANILHDSADSLQNIENIQYPESLPKDKLVIPCTPQDYTLTASDVNPLLLNTAFTQSLPILNPSVPHTTLNYPQNTIPTWPCTNIIPQYIPCPSILPAYNSFPLNTPCSQNLRPIIQLDKSLSVLENDRTLTESESSYTTSHTTQQYPTLRPEDIRILPGEDISNTTVDSVHIAPSNLQSPSLFSTPLLNTNTSQISILEPEFVPQNIPQVYPIQSPSDFSKPLLPDNVNIPPNSHLLDKIRPYNTPSELLDSTSLYLNSEFIHPNTQLSSMSKLLPPTVSPTLNSVYEPTRLPTYPSVPQYSPCPIPVPPIYQSSSTYTPQRPLSLDSASLFSPVSIPTSAFTSPIFPAHPVPLSPAYVSPLLPVGFKPNTAQTRPNTGFLSPNYYTPLPSEYFSKFPCAPSMQLPVSPISISPAFGASSPLFASPLSPLYTIPDLPTYLKPTAPVRPYKLSPVSGHRIPGLTQPFTNPLSVSYADLYSPVSTKALNPYISQPSFVCTNPIFDKYQHLPHTSTAPINKGVCNKLNQRPESQLLRPINAPTLSYASNPFMNIKPMVYPSHLQTQALPISPISYPDIDMNDSKRSVEGILDSTLPSSSLIQTLTTTPVNSLSGESICTDNNLVVENYREEPSIAPLESTTHVPLSEDAIGTLVEESLAPRPTASVPIQKLHQGPHLLTPYSPPHGALSPLLHPTPKLVPSQLKSPCFSPINFEHLPSVPLSTPPPLSGSPAFVRPMSHSSSVPLPSMNLPLMDRGMLFSPELNPVYGNPQTIPSYSAPYTSAPCLEYSQIPPILSTPKSIPKVSQTKPHWSQIQTVEPISFLQPCMKPTSSRVSSPKLQPTFSDIPVNYISLSPTFTKLKSNTPPFQGSIVPSPISNLHHHQSAYKSSTPTLPLLDTILQRVRNTQPTAPEYVQGLSIQNLLQNKGLSPLIPMSLKSKSTLPQKEITSPYTESDIIESTISPDFVNIPSMSQTIGNTFSKTDGSVSANLQLLSTPTPQYDLPQVLPYLPNSSESSPTLLPISISRLSTDQSRLQQSSSSSPKGSNFFQTIPSLKFSPLSHNPRYSYVSPYTKPIEITDSEQNPSSKPDSITTSISQSSLSSPIYTEAIETSDTSYQPISELSKTTIPYETLSSSPSYTYSLDTSTPITLAQKIRRYRPSTVPVSDASMISSSALFSPSDLQENLSPEMSSAEIHSSSSAKPSTTISSSQKSPNLAFSPYSLYAPQSLSTAHVPWLRFTNPSILRPLPSLKSSSSSQYLSPASVLPDDLENIAVSPQLTPEPASLPSRSKILKFSSEPIVQYSDLEPLPNLSPDTYTSKVPWWNTQKLPSAIVSQLETTIPDAANKTPIQSSSPILLPEESVFEETQPIKAPPSVSRYGSPDSSALYSVLGPAELNKLSLNDDNFSLLPPLDFNQKKQVPVDSPQNYRYPSLTFNMQPLLKDIKQKSSMYPILNLPPFSIPHNIWVPTTKSTPTSASSPKTPSAFSVGISPESYLSSDDTATYLTTELFSKAASTLHPINSIQSDLPQFSTLINPPSQVKFDAQLNTYKVPELSVPIETTEFIRESDTTQSVKDNPRYSTLTPLQSPVFSTSLEYSDIQETSSTPEISSSANVLQSSLSSRYPLDSSLISYLSPESPKSQSFISPASLKLSQPITQYPLTITEIQNNLPYNEHLVEVTPNRDRLHLPNLNNYRIQSLPIESKELEDLVPIEDNSEEPDTLSESIINQLKSKSQSVDSQTHDKYSVSDESVHEADIKEAEIIHNIETFNKVAYYLFDMSNLDKKLNESFNDVGYNSDIPSNILELLNEEVSKTYPDSPINIKPITDNSEILDNIVFPDNPEISDRIPESYPHSSFMTPQAQNNVEVIEKLNTFPQPLSPIISSLKDTDFSQKLQYLPFIKNPSYLPTNTPYSAIPSNLISPSLIQILRPSLDRIADFKTFPHRPEGTKHDEFYANNHIGKSPQVMNIPTYNIDSYDDTRASYTVSPKVQPGSILASELVGSPSTIRSASMIPNQYYAENPDIVTVDPEIPTENPIDPTLKSRPEFFTSSNMMPSKEDSKDFIKFSALSTPCVPYKNTENIKYSGYKTYQIPSFKSLDLYDPQINSPITIPQYQLPIQNLKMTTPLQTKLDLNNLQQGFKSNEYHPVEDLPVCETEDTITPLQAKLDINNLRQSLNSNEYSPVEDMSVCENNIDIDDELKTSIIKFINSNKYLKDNLNDNNDKLTIPLHNIAITKKEPSNVKTIQTRNPSIGLKVWKSKLKLIEAEIRFKVKDLSVTNFMPVVNNLDEYDVEEIRQIVKNYIDEKYGNHIEVNEPYKVNHEYTIIKDFEHSSRDNKYNILWPTNYV